MSDAKTYTVGEAATLVGVSSRTIKNWERDHKIPKPTRSPLNGHRVYSWEDIKHIQDIRAGIVTHKPQARRFLAPLGW